MSTARDKLTTTPRAINPLPGISGGDCDSIFASDDEQAFDPMFEVIAYISGLCDAYQICQTEAERVNVASELRREAMKLPCDA